MKKLQAYALLFALFISVSAFQDGKPLKLFILGDSISLQYGVYLEKYLKGIYTIDRKGSQEKALQNLDLPIDANGGNSKMVLDYLLTREKDPNFQPDVLLLNCGMHDIKRNPVTKEIAIDSINYRQNLEAIYKLLSKKKIPVVWVRSTGVIDAIHAAKSKAFDRYEKDVDQYNAIADQVFKKHKVPIIDLYSFTLKLGDDRYADHAHFIPGVIDAQAVYIADFLKKFKK
ncbi:SGNH/GDSL hydrolase family protein [Pedobacter sp. MC2016-14]|uniref:SGNH/GDSL hydrolase family protein n=1 Tax=Pedobacter sp. MC2016-14 TaxID=2897327 RepID=UPI001E2C5454|nr:SGNH/GDSL hydrolase family protein [Pedobacter sp. MC2016-14]MCD0487469.1 SGNH/GDSL hydrolase family protein [Pedobacter sp. MC2016-14]